MSIHGRKKYFIAKCHNLQALKTCQHTNVWACRDRTLPPQPKELLMQAFMSCDEVILVFSVNNCHGWHGYASMLTEPGKEQYKDDGTHEHIASEGDSNPRLHDESADKSGQDIHVSTAAASGDDSPVVWHHFRIRWTRLFLPEFGEQCLSFSSTSHLKLQDSSSVNKARNWQEISPESGPELCELIDQKYEDLVNARHEKARCRSESVGPAFFQPDGEDADMHGIWARLVQQVQSLGRVHLACAFGSQRYNLHTQQSDLDMFVIYEAPARQVLGLSPPQQTIKNRESELCDYTVHELSRYCELLHGGDPRCVETLFMNPDTIYCCSEEWKQLRQQRQAFLTRKCLEKYLRDACGSKGTKQLDKWRRLNPGHFTAPVSPHVNKLSYVIIRLLQNASHLALQRELTVYRPDDSAERAVLMSIRRGQCSYQQIQQHIDTLLQQIEDAKSSMTDVSDGQLQQVIEGWLVRLRYASLHSDVSVEHRGMAGPPQIR